MGLRLLCQRECQGRHATQASRHAGMGGHRILHELASGALLDLSKRRERKTPPTRVGAPSVQQMRALDGARASRQPDLRHGVGCQIACWPQPSGRRSPADGTTARARAGRRDAAKRGAGVVLRNTAPTATTSSRYPVASASAIGGRCACVRVGLLEAGRRTIQSPRRPQTHDTEMHLTAEDKTATP
eukprot:365847-Chlamydomonas_euryale.AAC.15